MTPRQLFVVALRVLGVWMLANAVSQLPVTAYFLITMLGTGRGQGSWENVLPYLGGTAAHAAIAIVLLLYAPWFAAVFFRDGNDPAAAPASTTTVERHALGIRMAGVVSIVLALEDLLVGLYGAANQESTAVSANWQTDLFRGGVQTVLGVLVVFQAAPIAAWMVRSAPTVTSRAEP